MQLRARAADSPEVVVVAVAVPRRRPCRFQVMEEALIRLIK
eukprot:COSAG01_NODE_4207_length_5240_cov_6.615325_4_plen_41_part_00